MPDKTIYCGEGYAVLDVANVHISASGQSGICPQIDMKTDLFTNLTNWASSGCCIRQRDELLMQQMGSQTYSLFWTMMQDISHRRILWEHSFRYLIMVV